MNTKTKTIEQTIQTLENNKHMYFKIARTQNVNNSKNIRKLTLRILRERMNLFTLIYLIKFIINGKKKMN